MEAQAKKMAEEVGDDYVWSNISFRQASQKDEETIQLALESEAAIHGNGDWAVKLGINLFYCANLSRSPLYCKQMPYNNMIYNAFGRSSATNDLTKFDSNGKEPCRPKKMLVAGKWCGKVWMSNQVHPLLARRDHEEQKRSIPSRVKPDLKLDEKPARRPSERTGTQTAETTSRTCKTVRKRKTEAEIRSSVKAKSARIEEQAEDSDDAPISLSFQLCKSNLRKKQMVKENPEPRNKGVKNRKQLNLEVQEDKEGGPSTRLRKRPEKPKKDEKPKSVQRKPVLKKPQMGGVKAKKSSRSTNAKVKELKAEFSCEMEGCTMSFGSKQELLLHERNICPVKGCGKKFFSHKYLVQHRRVHEDERPLKCPWKGCKMTFKWAWARTEHIRVHTGARPYACTEPGCGQTFRFVSDFSRHKRKTGHSVSKKGRG